MMAILEGEFQELASEWFINENEALKITTRLHDDLNPDTMKDMYASSNRYLFARKRLLGPIESVAKQRDFISLPMPVALYRKGVFVMTGDTSMSVAIVNFFTHNFVWLLLIAVLVYMLTHGGIWGSVKKLLGLGGERIATYKESVKWVVSHRPDDPRVAKAAMLRESPGTGKYKHRLILTYLDANNEMLSDAKGVPYGARRDVDGFDAEFDKVFGKNDLIVLD
ncbi:MAG: hypothetical protein LBR38_06670 [Synergistaceae bacterium]|jgi:hypothetical protein|nr:hypothetical protein [Synergistaceae bacterium]